MKTTRSIDAKGLLAEVADLNDMPAGDVIMLPGGFSHPLHGTFTVAWAGEPPQLIVMHGVKRRIATLHVTPLLEALGKAIAERKH